MKKGKLIVLEGIDGSGKATQSKLLFDRLKAEGFDPELIGFPQYGSPSAYFVEGYLKGDYGSAKEIGPYRASVFFALDRFGAKERMEAWLEEGHIVLADRYVSANIGHQGGKIADRGKRNAFFSWLYDLEFNVMGIPRPDLTVLLYVPPKVSQELIAGRGNAPDIHEVDLNHLKAASEAFLEAAGRYRWGIVSCTSDGRMLQPEKIHEEIWKGCVRPLLR